MNGTLPKTFPLTHVFKCLEALLGKDNVNIDAMRANIHEEKSSAPSLLLRLHWCPFMGSETWQKMMTALIASRWLVICSPCSLFSSTTWRPQAFGDHSSSPCSPLWKGRFMFGFWIINQGNSAVTMLAILPIKAKSAVKVMTSDWLTCWTSLAPVSHGWHH